MNDEIKAKIKLKVSDLPSKPGVYKMLNEDGKIIYIGKAKNLKNRVSSYFINTYKPEKVQQMVEHVFDFEYIIVNSELEALNLESNLIHLHQPFYNILLKDGKAFPYIKINRKKRFPKIEIVRKVVKDGSLYFGPYFAKINARELCSIINNTFKLRDCNYSLEKKLNRECLQYHIHNCLAPCTGRCSEDDYKKELEKVVAFLKGDLSYAKGVLQAKMRAFSDIQQYEKALEFREQLKHIEYLKSLVITQLQSLEDIDVFAIYEENNSKVVSVLIVRAGKTVGVNNYIIDDVSDKCEAYLNFITQYYISQQIVPDKVILQDCEIQSLEQYLNENYNSKTKVVIPQKGIKKKLLDLALSNAKEHYEKSIEKQERKNMLINRTLNSLKETLGLTNLPVRIEGFDISNLAGTNTVASMVVFENGVPNKKHYRKFKLETIGQNDFDSMRQVVTRRINEYNLQKDVSFSKKPDLILIDGGKGQLGYACNVLSSMNFKTDIISLAERNEEVYLPNLSKPIVMLRSNPALKLLQNVRDESHRFAITFQRNLRTKKTLTSELENVPLISKAKSIALIKYFKSVNKIKEASIVELMKVDGIGEKLAKNIFDYFNK